MNIFLCYGAKYCSFSGFFDWVPSDISYSIMDYTNFINKESLTGPYYSSWTYNNSLGVDCTALFGSWTRVGK